jgi:hypothetical protein
MPPFGGTHKKGGRNETFVVAFRRYARVPVTAALHEAQIVSLAPDQPPKRQLLSPT